MFYFWCPVLRILLGESQVINSLSQIISLELLKWSAVGHLVFVGLLFCMSLGGCKAAAAALILWPQIPSFRNALLTKP